MLVFIGNMKYRNIQYWPSLIHPTPTMVTKQQSHILLLLHTTLIIILQQTNAPPHKANIIPKAFLYKTMTLRRRLDKQNPLTSVVLTSFGSLASCPAIQAFPP